MKKLAIVGTGISGIAAAYYLRNEFDIEVFEREDYSGGHTSTIEVDEPGRALPVDTGFIVYNEATYPNLVRLFDELGVETAPTVMNFGLWDRETGLEFGFRGLNALFGRRANLVSPRFWGMIRDLFRFFKGAREDIAMLESRPELTLGDYLRERGFNEGFLYDFILPMASAIWSAPIKQMLDFPARTFMVFFGNHGILGRKTHLAWRYVKGGSQTYNRKIREALYRPVRLGDPVRSVRRRATGDVMLQTASGEHRFDYVLLASHADESLAMLEEPTAREREILSKFRYQQNRVVLHTDPSVMPPRRRVWTAWNYKKIGSSSDPESIRTSTIYYMNHLQNLDTTEDYFVSVNDFDTIDPERIIRSFDYDHPIFDIEAVRAQAELPQLNEDGPVFYSGAYHRYGFHEDGLMSALAAAESLRKVSARVAV